MKEYEDICKNIATKFQEFARTTRTDAPSKNVFSRVYVESKDRKMPLNSIASIDIQQPSTFIIDVWDPEMISSVQKAISDSDLGFTPVTAGKVIKINVPLLSVERKTQIVNCIKKELNSTNLSIRDERQKIYKKIQSLPEDERNRLKKDIDKVTDKYNSMIQDIANTKIKEIMK